MYEVSSAVLGTMNEPNFCTATPSVVSASVSTYWTSVGAKDTTLSSTMMLTTVTPLTVDTSDTVTVNVAGVSILLELSTNTIAFAKGECARIFHIW